MATKMSDKVKGELITRIMVEMKSAALGFNTCEVVYNYKVQKYEVLNVDTEIGNKEIQIL